MTAQALQPAPHAHAPAPAVAGDPPAAIVAGGGIAGIAAAIRLADAGLRVTLLETRPRLGGRATSFEDPRSSEVLDNCQHVVMGCCTAYLHLLDRLGVRDQIEWTRDQLWLERGSGRASTVRPSAIPAPFHFAPAVARAKFLSAREKAALAWGAHVVAHAKREAWRDRTFAQFLAHARQPDSLVRKFWEPVVVSACNLPCDRACAASALMVFQDGFFGSPRAADIGVSRVPLLRLYDRAAAALAGTGGVVRLGFSVERVGPAHVEGVCKGRRERLDAPAVVCALPIERALGVIDPAILSADGRFPPMLTPGDAPAGDRSRWAFSPILGVHLAFDRPVLRAPHAVLVPDASAAPAPAVQWLFRKDDEGRRVHAVISAADAWVPMPEAEIVERVRADIEAHIPEARGARVEWARAVKEKRATFAPTPEVERLRPPATGSSGLILAGDYTATGWPATMEGAARSGFTAAAAVLDRLGRSADAAAASAPAMLPRAGLARWLVARGA